MDIYDLDVLRKNIKLLREHKGYSRYDLSIASDIHYQYYCAIENGNKIPNFKSLISIANALDTTITCLFKADISYDEIQLNLKKKIILELNLINDKDNLKRHYELLDALLRRSGSVINNGI